MKILETAMTKLPIKVSDYMLSIIVFLCDFKCLSDQTNLRSFPSCI